MLALLHWVPRPSSRSLPTHDSTGDSWTLMGKSRSVSLGSLLLSPESWWAHSFVCSLQESVSPVLCKIWQLYDGVNGDLLQEVLCLTHVCWTQSPVPVVVQGWPVPPQEMLRHSLAQSLWGLWVLVHTGFVWFPLVSLRVPGLILNLILALLPSCGFSFALGHGYFFFFLVGSNILLLTVVQQQFVILEFMK